MFIPKKKNNYLLFLLLFALSVASCRKMVQDEFPYFKPIPTVNAILIADNPIAVSVTMAQKLDSFQLNPVSDATVLLFANGVFSDTLQLDGSGYFTSEILAETGKTYRCEVVVTGYETASSTDSIPEKAQLINIEHISNAGKDEEGLIFPAMRFTFRNNPSKRLYFEAMLSVGDIFNIIDPVILNEGLPIALFSNETITDTVYTMTLNYKTGGAHAVNGKYYPTLYPICLELRSVSYDYYRYMKHYFLYTNALEMESFPNGTTAFKLHTNINNGLGIFASYSAVVSDTIIPTTPWK